jgi:GT2 family glycosyltransferase
VILVGNGVVPDHESLKFASRYIQLEMNIGFSAGCNRGALAASRRLLCFMNDDARFVDDTPAALVRAISAETPIVAPYSNRAKPPQGDVPRDRVPQHDAYPEMVTGLCMMLPADLFHLVGGFDPRLTNWEDDALCLKAAARGKRCRVVGGTWVEHERHASFRALGLDPDAVIRDNKAKFDRLYPKIRVVAISKNEESCIEDFFSQFSPATRDWCLLDTGSTDATIEKARAIGVRVETCEFKDFAQARNEAVKRFGAGADWIVMLDPDERLDAHCISHLRGLLSGSEDDILIAPLEAVDQNGGRRAFVPKPFAFRCKPGIFWIFKVHEKLVGSLKQALIRNARIEHVLAFHEDGRRQAASGTYDSLMKEEPYFTNPEYKAKILSAWPILDYDRPDDSRIRKISTGPLVSVVIPTYRRPELLQKAIESALGQDYEPVEVVVVGDCDDTLIIGNGQGYHGRYASDLAARALALGGTLARLRVFNLPKNHGAGGAAPRNYGIMMAAGPLIAYCDDDNQLEPDHISSLYEALMEAKADWAFSSMKAVDHVFTFEKPEKGRLDTSCVLHKKLLIKEHGWWKDRIEAGYAHDWEFFSRWLERPWAATKRPTLIYNAETSGQKDYLTALAKGGP